MAEGLLPAVPSGAEPAALTSPAISVCHPPRGLSSSFGQGDSKAISRQAQRDLSLCAKDVCLISRQIVDDSEMSPPPIHGPGAPQAPLAAGTSLQEPIPDPRLWVEKQNALSCPTLPPQCCVTLAKSLALSVSHFLQLHNQLSVL